MARLTPVEQHGAVVGLQELAQRLDPLDDQRQVVLAAQREHRIDQIVPRALLAQMHLEPVGEEGEEVCRRFCSLYSASRHALALDCVSTCSRLFAVAQLRAERLAHSNLLCS